MTVTIMYPVSLKVPARLLGPLLELFEGEGIEVKIGNPIESDARPPRGPRRRGVHATCDIATKALAEGPKTSAQIAATMVAAGYSPNSAHPALGKLKARGKVVQTGPALWELAPLGKPRFIEEEKA